jgi:uncharacterized protein (DUF1778 family)
MPPDIVLPIETAAPATSVVNVRLDAAERARREAAAAQAHTSLSDFMLCKAMESAETEMLNRSMITIPDPDWESVAAWLARPAAPNSALAELTRLKPVWED